MELKPYFGLSKNGLNLLKRDHHKKLDTKVSHVDNQPFVLPESSPIYHKVSQPISNTRKNKKKNSKKYIVKKQTSNEEDKINEEEEEEVVEIANIIENIEKQIHNETKHILIEPQQISYYDTAVPSRLEINNTELENRSLLDRDQIAINSSVLNKSSSSTSSSSHRSNYSNENFEQKNKSIANNHNIQGSKKYKRLKNEKNRRKIEKWQQAFEMNGIIANKEDLKVYQQFIKLLVKVPTSSNRINIIEMALDDASIAEGEALLMSDFC